MNRERITYSKELVLVVDADDKAREMVERMLRHLGFSTKGASDATDALLEMERSSYTVLICDVTQPDADGLELMNGLELIKQAKEVHPQICILAVTSHDVNYTYMDIIEAGASDFINKPVLVGELEAKLKRALTERNIKEELSNLSITDSVTRLYNRRHFDQRLQEEVIRAESQGNRLAVAVIDLDDVSPAHEGHAAVVGRDERLQRASQVIADSINKGLDLGFRLRGNQFAVILIGSDREQARVVCSRIRRGLEKECRISAAFGIATFSKGMTAKELSELADQKLYQTKQELILAVDDDEIVLEPTVEILRHLGFRTVSAGNAADALMELKRRPFTILLTDIKMSGMSGLELIRRVKKDHPEVCVIAMTAYTEEYSYLDVIEAGASDFINKPFAYTELEAKITRAIAERNLKRELNDLSITDSLTGLHNQRYFFERLEQEVNRAERQGNRLSLIMMDLDNFKEHNDRYGHRSGDEVLKRAGQIVSACIRRGVDTGYRYGGDEFGIILIDSDTEIARFISRRIQKTLEKECGISASFGTASFKKGMKPEDLLEEADQRLYALKAEKRGDTQRPVGEYASTKAETEGRQPNPTIRRIV